MVQVWDAVQEGDVARLRLHLEQGADTGTRDGEGLSLLHWAADRGEMLRYRILRLEVEIFSTLSTYIIFGS